MQAKLLILALVTALLPPRLDAANYNRAAFTRLLNQVNVLKDNAAPKPAAVGEEITTVSSVATGPDSRAELRFPDNSLTRIGANSRFTLKGDGRTLDLDAGVMMLQVPKKMGGAKVRTAAVTAAVTGTTVLFEYLPGGYVKLICVEGSVDLYLNSDPSHFRTINAGEMIIMKANGKTIPEPVDVDLSLLLRTSKLISSDDVGPNQKQINQAVQKQNKELKAGDLVQTNMVIEGRGTLVSLNADTRMNLFRNVTIRDTSPQQGGQNPPQGPGGPGQGPGGTPPGQPGSGGTTPPGGGTQGGTQTSHASQGFAPLIAGTSVLNDTGRVYTNPHVDAYDLKQGAVVNSAGVRYSGAVNGYFPYFAFASNEVVSPALQPLLDNPTDVDGNPNDGTWALFAFEQLVINGTPGFIIGSTGTGPSLFPDIHDVILASLNGLYLGDSSQFPDLVIPPGAGGYITPLTTGETLLDLTSYPIDNLVLYAQTGDVILRSDPGSYVIKGFEQNVTLMAAGAFNDLLIEGDILLTAGSETLSANLTGIAGRDVKVAEAAVQADSVSLEAGQDVIINESDVVASQRQISIRAKRHISITDSSDLRALTALTSSGRINLVSEQGDITIEDSRLEGREVELEAQLGNINLTNVTSSGDVFKATTLGTNGWITIGGGSISANTLIKLYAEGASGGVRFTENVTLNSASVRIAGKTVEIVRDKIVNVPAGTRVFTDTPNYGTVDYGNFSLPPLRGTFDQRNDP